MWGIGRRTARRRRGYDGGGGGAGGPGPEDGGFFFGRTVVVVERLENGILIAPDGSRGSNSVVVVTSAVVVVDAGGAVDGGVVGGGTDTAGVVIRLPPGSNRPGNDLTAGKPPASMPGSLVAFCMKFLKIVAGNEPPLTLRPRTLVIFSVLPEGNPIHTAAVSLGVKPTNQASP